MPHFGLSSVGEKLHRVAPDQLKDATSKPAKESWVFMKQFNQALNAFGKQTVPRFILGVTTVLSIVWVYATRPQDFWLLYSLAVPTVVARRFLKYRKLKKQYYLLDFCYYVQVVCLASMFVAPESQALAKVSFMFSTGPLLCAIPTWGNALICHSLDKMTSVAIHVLPAWACMSRRWHGPGSDAPACLSAGDYALAMGAYLLWQALYLWWTEVVKKDRFEADQRLESSLRYLTKDQTNGAHRLVKKALRTAKVMGAKENFDSGSMKTKLVFVASQLVYTAASLSVTGVLYSNMSANLVFASVASLWAVQAGGLHYQRRAQRKIKRSRQRARGRHEKMKEKAAGVAMKIVQS